MSSLSLEAALQQLQLNHADNASSGVATSAAPVMSMQDTFRYLPILQSSIQEIQILQLLQNHSKHHQHLKLNNDYTGRDQPASQQQQQHQIIQLLQQQRTLQHQFYTYQQQKHRLQRQQASQGTAQQHADTPLPNPATTLTNHQLQIQLQENQSVLSSIIRQLNENEILISTYLNDNHPTLTNNITKFNTDVARITKVLKEMCAELQGPDHFYGTLVSALQSSSSYLSDLPHLKSRADTLRHGLHSRQQEVQQEMAIFQQQQAQKCSEISNYQEELKSLKLRTIHTVKHHQELTVSEVEIQQQLQQRELHTLRQKIAELKRDIAIDQHVHGKTTKFLSRQKEQLDQYQQGWESTFESKTSEYDDRYKQLQQQRLQEQEKLAKLQKRYYTDKNEKLALVSERETREHERQVSAEQLHQQSIAANCIRYWWRVYWRKRSKELAKIRKKKLAAARAKRLAAKRKW